MGEGAGRPGVRLAASAALAAVLAVGGCSPGKTAFQLGVPGARIEMQVEGVAHRDGVHDVSLHASGWGLRTYLPASETCARVIGGAGSVSYVSAAPYGALERGGERCNAIGIGSLREWRSRRPRGDTASESVVPSAPARYEAVYRDEEVTFLRGRFPLASRLGFTHTADVIAVVPNTTICRAPLSRGTSTLEYFHTGKRVLALVSSDGRCPIEGLIRPPGPADLGS